MINIRAVKHLVILKNLTFYISLISAILLPQTVGVVSALEPEQRNVFDSGVDFFNVERDGALAAACAPSTTTPDSTSGPVFLIGDSIGTQIDSGLGARIGDFQANVLGGRTLPQGIDAINSNKDYIAKASTVIVELGTNAGGFTASNVSSMVSKLRGYNPKVSIFWVDTAVVERDDYAVTLSGVNKIIQEQSIPNNFQIISWNKEVFGSSADPTNINPDAPDNGYIRRADQFVHLTTKGIDAMVKLIVPSLNGSTAASGYGCACVGSSTSLTGKDNKAKIWNYLTQVKQLSPESAAGIMGNLQAESAGTWDPRVVEYAYSDPPHRSDTVPPNIGPQGQPGYGLVQWTSPGRKQGLRDFSAQRGVIAGDLVLQLDYLWQELENSYKSVLAVLQQPNTNDLATPTYKFLVDFEVPADIEGNKPIRLNNARDIYNEFASGQSGATGGGTTGGQSGCTGSSENGIVNTDGYAFPVGPLNKSQPRPTDSHAEPKYAFDFMRNGGTAVYAVFSGTIGRVNTSYGGVSGCASINLYGDDGWKYWYGHLQKPLVTEGQTNIKAGQKIAEVASFGGSACYGGGPHLHLDRGYPKGVNGGGGDLSATTDARRDPTFIPFLQKLYDELP